MDYNKLLKELIKNVDFDKYDQFSTSKYCCYINVGNKDLVLIWRNYDKSELLEQDYEQLGILQRRIEEAIREGARLPQVLSFDKTNTHLFQLQERVMGKKIGYYENLINKTTVEDFIDVLRTIDIMAEVGINVDQGFNCLVDDNGHINLFDFYLTPVRSFKVNARPYLFYKMIFREPEYLKENDIKNLEKVIRKWVKACVIYFNKNGLKREFIYEEIMLTIKEYSFISMEDKDRIINEILDETLQINK